MIDLPVFDLGSPASYALAFSLPTVDALFPAVPSETAVIALGVSTAGSWDAHIVLIVALAATGAFAGDNIC